MADKKFEDYEGKPILISPNQRKFEDFEGNSIQPYKDPITAASEKVAPWIGRATVEALPFAGSILGSAGGPLGTGLGITAGTMFKNALKSARPDLVGESPQGLGENLLDLGKEIGLNQVLPGGLGKLGGLLTQVGMQGPKAAAAIKMSNFPAVREGVVQNLADSVNKQLAPDTLRAGRFTIQPDYQPLGDVTPIKIQPKTADYQPIKIEPPDWRSPKPIVNVTGPIERVKSGGFDVIPGPVKKAQDKLGDLISGDKFDAGKILEELTGKNVSNYTDAMPTDTYQNVRKLLETAKDLQKENLTDRVISISKGRVVWNLAGGSGLGALFGHPGMGLTIGVARSAPMVLNSMLGRLMSNPETAQIVTQAMRTSVKAPEAGLLSKALVRILQGGADLAATPER